MGEAATEIERRPCFSCGALVPVSARICESCHRRPFLDRSEPVRDFDTMSLVALLLAVLWIGWAGSIIGMILGYRRLAVLDEHPDELWGRPLATGAIISGWFALGILALMVLYVGTRLAFYYL